MKKMGEVLGAVNHFKASHGKAECATKMSIPRLSIQAARLQVVKTENDLLEIMRVEHWHLSH